MKQLVLTIKKEWRIILRIKDLLNLSFKAYKNKKNKVLHNKIDIAGCIWNHIIALQRRYYALYGSYISLYRMQKHIAKVRRRTEFWQLVNSQAVQEICERVDTAYKRFFKKIAKRPPKFKKVNFFNSFTLKQSGWTLNGNVLTIQKKRYKFSKSREIEQIKRVTIKRDTLGDIYFIFTCDIKPKKYKRVGSSTIGMDFGLTTFLTCSNGDEIKSPEFLKKDIKNIKRLSRALSKKQKGSNNRKRARIKLSREHIKVANRRHDFQWKLAHKLCRENILISIEDLNMKAMQRLWGRKISDLAFSDFVLRLKEVALKYGTEIVEIDRYYPSSKLCGCGFKNDELQLKDRVWLCPSCGKVNNRDLRASINILGEGIRLYRTKSKTTLVAS